jgi:plastocyanin
MRGHSATGRLCPQATLLAMVALLVLAACSSSSTTSGAPGSQSSGSEAPGSSAPVMMSGLAFTVAEITVSVGDVTFVSQDAVAHLLAEGENGIEATSPRIQETAIAANAQGIITFSAAGDYHVTCLIHHAMNIVVHVQ